MSSYDVFLLLQDGKKLATSANMVIDRVGGRCSLCISNVTGDDEAEYVCEARNEHGSASTAQQLLVNCSYSTADSLPPPAPAHLCVLFVCIFACLICIQRSVLTTLIMRPPHMAVYRMRCPVWTNKSITAGRMNFTFGRNILSRRIAAFSHRSQRWR